MVKKKFETIIYDPIEAEHRRSLAKQASSPVYPGGNSMPQTMPAIPRSDSLLRPSELEASLKPNAVPLAEQARAWTRPKPIAGQNRPPRREKKRSFHCGSRELDRELDMFLKRLSEIADTVVPFQVIMRAACICLMRSEEQIIEEIRKGTPLARPATYDPDYAVFEEYWIDILAAALRKVRPHQSS